MPIPSYTVPCLGNACTAREIYEFRLAKPEGFSFKAGQFVLFDVPLLENPADIQTRAFSIASAPDEEELLFLAKLKEGGRASLWIEKMLSEGTHVRLQGPFGVFCLHPENPKDYLLVGTSSGIVPFRSQIVEALHAGETRRIDLLFCVRDEEDLFWTETFANLATQYPNLHVHLCLSRGSNTWQGLRGRVQTVVPTLFPDLSNKQLYICGNPDMTTEMKKLCLEEWGVARGDLHVEGYV